MPPELAAQVEAALADAHRRGRRTRQLQRVLANLRRPSTRLLERVLAGEVGADVLARGTHRAFWPELHAQPHRQPHNRVIILDADVGQVRDTLLRCGACKSNTVRYYELQTRSSDEPMTAHCECVTCGKRWKM